MWLEKNYINIFRYLFCMYGEKRNMTKPFHKCKDCDRTFTNQGSYFLHKEDHKEAENY